jgi:pyrimidine-nucleoside phosphorylase
MNLYDLIAKKRDGGEHTPEEIHALVRAVVDGTMPDYQASAWLMAVYLRGMTEAETLALTLAMRDSGERVRLDDIPGRKLDKHSTGGVGDKTTLVVVPLLAAAGVPMLKMSGRGLGFSGGTVDKLESIPGFRTDLSVEEAREQVRRVGVALIGQSPSLVPADKRLYALRDVTATIESLPLIASSIMSKKLAGGADCVLLDVKAGRGAFMKTPERATELAKALVEIGKGAGVQTVALVTAMDEPLGYAVGNALEVAEACAMLTGKGRIDARFRELCLTLAARGLVLADRAADEEAARLELDRILHSGAAADRFAEIVRAQGGDPGIVGAPERLPAAPIIWQVQAGSGGYVQAIDAEAVGRLAMEMGAGRAKKEDAIDPAAGIVLWKKVGDAVRAGDDIAELYLRDESRAAHVANVLRAAFTFSSHPQPAQPLIYGVLE